MTPPATVAGQLEGFDYVLEPGTSDWTLVLLHGTGGDEHDLLDLGRTIAPEATLVGVRGTVLENGVTRRFFARRSMTDIDVEDMLAKTDDLHRFLTGLVTSRALDATRIAVVGYSNGANIALSLLLRHPGVVRAAGLLRPVLYHVPDPVPSLADTTVLAAVGGRDPFTPPATVDALRRVLRDGGATADVRVAPDAGHELRQEDLAALTTWARSVMTP